jgi:hypothetical protein
MSKKSSKHVNRRLTEEERARHAKIRENALRDYPPKKESGGTSSPQEPKQELRDLKAISGKVEFESNWQELEELELKDIKHQE